MKHAFWTLMLAAAIAAFAASPAFGQDTAPGLGGTTFTDSDPTTPTCNADGSAGTFTFAADGPSVSPAYPGTYSETGTVTVSAPDASLRQRITNLTATFTIDSPNGDVIGTKTFQETGDPFTNVPNARCTVLFDGSIRSSIFVSSDDLRYSATITLPDGRTCTQEGSTSLALVDNSSVLLDSFTETFLNDLAAPTATCDGGGGGEEPPPPPPAPTSKEQCRKDPGYAAFGFKNQGQCVAFVERGSK